MKKLLTTLFAVSSLGCIQVNAQGSSDAGIGSVGCLQNGHMKFETARSTVAGSVAVGMGENDTKIITPQVEIKIANEKGYFEFKLPYQVISGKVGTNFGIGDLMATYSLPVKMKSKSMSMSATGGFRFGLGNAGDGNVGKPFPMVYQTSLATTDVLLGANLKWQKYLSIALGVQQPVIQYNINGYEKTGYRGNDTSYFASSKLKRSGDVMLRIEGRYDFKEDFGISAGPLVMYHLMEDKMTSSTATEFSVVGSSGLTLNVVAGVYYKTKTWIFDLNAGVPVIKRDAMPDGLSRTWVVIPRFTLYL
jgi:uncharacterized protein YaiE (UPF0345 family)